MGKRRNSGKSSMGKPGVIGEEDKTHQRKDMKKTLRILQETAYLSETDESKHDFSAQPQEFECVYLTETDPLVIKSEEDEVIEQKEEDPAFQETDPLAIKSEEDEVIGQKDKISIFQTDAFCWGTLTKIGGPITENHTDTHDSNGMFSDKEYMPLRTLSAYLNRRILPAPDSTSSAQSTTTSSTPDASNQVIPVNTSHCTLCHRGFFDSVALLQHLKQFYSCRIVYRAEGQVVHVCFCCQQPFSSLFLRRRHFESEPSHQSTHQEICLGLLQSILQPGQKIENCIECGVSFLVPGRHYCPACLAVYLTVDSLREHWRKVPVCKAYLTSISADDALVGLDDVFWKKQAQRDKKFSCDMCKAAFDYPETLCSHSEVNPGCKSAWSSATDSKPESFQSVEQWLISQKKSKGAIQQAEAAPPHKPVIEMFSCDVCDSTFKLLMELERHCEESLTCRRILSCSNSDNKLVNVRKRGSQSASEASNNVEKVLYTKCNDTLQEHWARNPVLKKSVRYFRLDRKVVKLEKTCLEKKNMPSKKSELVKKLTCSLCTETFEKLESLHAHWKSSSKCKKNVEMSSKGDPKHSQTGILQQAKTSRCAEKFSCSICKMAFPTQKELEKHRIDECQSDVLQVKQKRFVEAVSRSTPSITLPDVCDIQPDNVPDSKTIVPSPINKDHDTHDCNDNARAKRVSSPRSTLRKTSTNTRTCLQRVTSPHHQESPSATTALPAGCSECHQVLSNQQDVNKHIGPKQCAKCDREVCAHQPDMENTLEVRGKNFQNTTALQNHGGELKIASILRKMPGSSSVLQEDDNLGIKSEEVDLMEEEEEEEEEEKPNAIQEDDNLGIKSEEVDLMEEEEEKPNANQTDAFCWGTLTKIGGPITENHTDTHDSNGMFSDKECQLSVLLKKGIFPALDSTSSAKSTRTSSTASRSDIPGLSKVGNVSSNTSTPTTVWNTPSTPTAAHVPSGSNISVSLAGTSTGNVSSTTVTLGDTGTGTTTTATAVFTTVPSNNGSRMVFPCIQCGLIFITAEERANHFASSSPCLDNYFFLSLWAHACCVCAHLFTDVKSFLEHLNTKPRCKKQSVGPPQCPSCKQIFKSSASCQSHILSTGCAKSYPCLCCKAVFRNSTTRHRHFIHNDVCLLRHIMEPSIMQVCELCKETYLSLLPPQNRKCMVCSGK